MPLSKKIRFEVFKRDGFRCVYCGKNPPEVTLEVDHIEALSRGGTDDINNLLTSCFDCNRGKRNIPLSRIPQKLKDNLDVLKEREEQIAEYRNFTKKIKAREKKDISLISKKYSDFYGWDWTYTFKNSSLKNFIRRMPLDEIEFALDITFAKFPQIINSQEVQEKITRYFCGICWNKIRGTKCPE